MKKLIPLALLALSICSCAKSGCDSDEATNKMLALGKASARLASKGGDAGSELAMNIGVASGPVSELIAQQKYVEACAKADEVAKSFGLDLVAEQKDMVTIQDLQKDGGKGEGACSIADASRKQMEVFGLLQADVTAGKRDSSVLEQFNYDTRKFGEFLTTDPGKACELIDKVRAKYKL